MLETLQALRRQLSTEDPKIGVCVGQTINLEKGKLVFCRANCAGQCKATGKDKRCHYDQERRLAENIHYCRGTMIIRAGNKVSCPRFVDGKCRDSSSPACLHGNGFVVTNPAV